MLCVVVETQVSGFRESRLRRRSYKEPKVSLPRRVRQVMVQSSQGTAWDALRMVSPAAFLSVSRPAADAFSPPVAAEGLNLFRVLRDTEACPIMRPG